MTSNPAIIGSQGSSLANAELFRLAPIDEVVMAIAFSRDKLKRHGRAITALLVVGILFGLFVGGAQPVAVGLIPSPWDKLAHASLFAVLAACIGLASGLRGGRVVRGRGGARGWDRGHGARRIGGGGGRLRRGRWRW